MRPGEMSDVGWKEVLLRVWQRLVHEQLSITAAGTAFYALLATFPALTAIVSAYGLLFSPSQVSAQLAFLAKELPPEPLELVVTLVRGLAGVDRSKLGLGAAGGALITLWGASLGVKALLQALNVVYGEEEKRKLARRLAVALLLTMLAIAGAFAASFVVIGLPLAVEWLGLDAAIRRFFIYARWPAVLLLFWLALLVLYRFGPSRAQPRWSWVSWGAFVATAVWVGGTALLSWYAARTGTFFQAYGSIGYVVILLAWFLLSAHAVILGAVVNAELERQTGRDTTVGAERPLGQRGAHVADTVGR